VLTEEAGIEPTTAIVAANGFEDRGSLQTPSTSNYREECDKHNLP